MVGRAQHISKRIVDGLQNALAFRIRVMKILHVFKLRRFEKCLYAFINREPDMSAIDDPAIDKLAIAQGIEEDRPVVGFYRSIDE